MAIKDSGQRSHFSTGAQRDCQEGKGRMDLLPFRALIEVAKVYEEGAKKYNDNNWRKGIPLSRYIDSGTRHLAKWMIGLRDEPHLAQACWNLLCLIETSQMIEEGLLPAELNDLPYHVIEQLENPNNIPPLVTADNRPKLVGGPTTGYEFAHPAEVELEYKGRPLPTTNEPKCASEIVRPTEHTCCKYPKVSEQ